MSIPAGALNRKVQFQRRAVVPTVPGSLRGAYEDFRDPVWGAFKEAAGRPATITVGTLDMVGRVGNLTIRSSSTASALQPADSAVIGGTRFEIRAISASPVADGIAIIGLQEAPSRATYAREADVRGEAVTLRRLGTGNAVTAEVVVRAIVTGYQPDELVGGIVQGMRKIVLLAADVEASGWVARSGYPLIETGSADRIIVRGRPLTPIAVDDSTHQAGGILNAYEISAKG